MLRKIFKTGNSMVVSLPREMLESLRAADGSDVSVELEDGKIIIVRYARQCQAWMKTLRAS